MRSPLIICFLFFLLCRPGVYSQSMPNDFSTNDFHIYHVESKKYLTLLPQESDGSIGLTPLASKEAVFTILFHEEGHCIIKHRETEKYLTISGEYVGASASIEGSTAFIFDRKQDTFFFRSENKFLSVQGNRLTSQVKTATSASAFRLSMADIEFGPLINDFRNSLKPDIR